jgi:hypothetical protein
MSDTALGHRLVRGYLRELDMALRDLPAAQARELREQITAHLEEALPPGAGDREVAAVLGRLGSPAGLTAEAQAAGGRPGQAPAAHAGWARLAHVPRRTLVLAGIAVALIGLVAGYLIVCLTAGALQPGIVATWWYPQDASHRVDVTAGNVTQSTVPIRSGQRQGFVISLYNPTSVTQTIVGAAYGVPFGTDVQIAVSVRYWTPPDSAGAGLVHRVGYALPGPIPPHQTRLLRVLWTSAICLSKGESTGFDQLFLRVQVGWFTRTELIPQQAWAPQQAWDLTGPSKGQPQWRRCL